MGAGHILAAYGSIMLGLGMYGWSLFDFDPNAKSAIVTGGGIALASWILAFLVPQSAVCLLLARALALTSAALAGWRASKAYDQPGKEHVFQVLAGMTSVSALATIWLLGQPLPRRQEAKRD